MVEPNSPSDSAVSITQNQQGKARHWSITLNNPTAEELSLWENATQNQWVKQAIGQLERGEETETLHLQGYLRTDNVRFAQVKKLFPRAHIEVARQPQALQRYVQKEDTRVAELRHTVGSVQVLTSRKLQDSMAFVVYDRITHKAYAKKWQRTYEHGWQYTVDYDGDWMPSPYFDYDAWIKCIEVNTEYIRAHADEIIDTAVREEIVHGTFGAEYATANVACRQALKRYLVEILIRNANQTRSEETPIAPPSPNSPLADVS